MRFKIDEEKQKRILDVRENNKYTVYYLEKTVYQDEQSASCISSKCINANLYKQ